jgi:DNA-binding beta-propeller fold protein YncE
MLRFSIPAVLRPTACLLLVTACFGPAHAVTLHLPGYTITPFVSLPVTYYSPSDIELDSGGNLYIPTQTDGIQRVTPLGAISTWSSAPAIDLSLLPSAEGYGAGRALCHCILSLFADGSYSTLHADSFEWTYVKLAPDGSLYATIWAGAGQGLYRIDRGTGTPTLLVNGGPGPAGAGWYWDMGFGLDGNLYALGYDGSAYGLLRLDGGHFTRVATLPHAGIGLTRDASGIFYTATSYNDLGEVWIIDPMSGSASLLASELSWPAAVAFDPSTDRLYVSEQLGQRTVYAITRSGATPTQAVSWGGVKARYR